jgi:predicted membrane protein (TIGR00267 family)
MGEIARRYFAMNAFDGVLTMLGLVMGSMMAGVESPKLVIATGLATSVAMGVSGLWGAYLTETAERKRKLLLLSRQTLTDQSDTQIGKASRFAIVLVSLVDGLSPFLAALLVLTPFYLAWLFPTMVGVYYTAIGVGLLMLFGLGIFLGRISGENVVGYGVKTVIAGIFAILISYLLGVEG